MAVVPLQLNHPASAMGLHKLRTLGLMVVSKYSRERGKKQLYQQLLLKLAVTNLMQLLMETEKIDLQWLCPLQYNIQNK